MAVQQLAPRSHRYHPALVEPRIPEQEAEPLNREELPAPLAGIVERLYRDYPAIPLAELISLVRRCRRDIDTGAPDDCIPELVERLARARLTN